MTEKKKEKLELVWKIGYALGIAFIVYTVLPIKADLSKQIDEIKKENKDNFIYLRDQYMEMKEDISKIPVERQKEIGEALDKVQQKIDKIYAWFRTKNSEKEKSL